MLRPVRLPPARRCQNGEFGASTVLRRRSAGRGRSQRFPESGAQTILPAVTMSEPSLFVILLAAGRASRFGGVKQLARYRGLPLVTRALREAEAVCGARTASSIASGVAAVADRADGVLLMLADQPLVDRQHLRALIAAWSAAPDGIAATGYAGKTGVPALFPRRCFDELRSLTGDRGAQALLQQAGEQLCIVPFEGAAADVDRPADLQALQGRTMD
jgi:molybdenum cofactor cytidylyltransferase